LLIPAPVIWGEAQTSKTVAVWDPAAEGGAGDYVTESVTKFIYDGWRLVAETNADNELIRSYVWSAVPGAGGVGGLRAIRVHNPDAPGGGFPVTATYWVISDDNGNVTALVDADTEAVVASYQYTPYGQLLHAEGDAAALANNPFGFSTKYHDAELPGDDLVYYGYRYYHPALQVWLNRDPIAEDGGLNLYAFCANQPNSLFDPLGLTWDGQAWEAPNNSWSHWIKTRWYWFKRDFRRWEEVDPADEPADAMVPDSYTRRAYHWVVRPTKDGINDSASAVVGAALNPKDTATNSIQGLWFAATNLDVVADSAAEKWREFDAMTPHEKQKAGFYVLGHGIFDLAVAKGGASGLRAAGFARPTTRTAAAAGGARYANSSSGSRISSAGSPGIAMEDLLGEWYNYALDELARRHGFGPGTPHARQPLSPSSGSVDPSRGGMFNQGLRTTESASDDLLRSVQSKGRTIDYALPGSDELRYLDYMKANANVGGENMTNIILRQNPTKVEVLEEFLHGTQFRRGVIDRLGVQGAEVHVKDFMLRHQRLLGITDQDAAILRQMIGGQ